MRHQKALKDAVIVAYGRAPIAKSRKGFLRETHPASFAAEVLNGVLAKVPALDPAQIEDVIVGCAKPEGKQNYNFGRVVVRRAGLPCEVPAQTLTRFCASGLQAIATAANCIMTGQADVICAGGVESMTAIPMGIDPATKDPWLLEHDPELYLPMGVTAENVAREYGITREQMDAMAVESHRKAAEARACGAFMREIIPVSGTDEAGNPRLFLEDEGIRPNTSAEGLASLKPCFLENGTVTAATSSQTSDSAAFLVMMSADKAKELDIQPVARFVSFAVAGVPARIMGTGPMKAVPKAMELAGLTVEDMDVIELNEAFAAQAIPCIRELGLDPAKVNPRGGAIALGHPLGATGAILTCKALSYLEDTDGHYALVTMCIGGGMGAAGIFERI